MANHFSLLKSGPAAFRKTIPLCLGAFSGTDLQCSRRRKLDSMSSSPPEEYRKPFIGLYVTAIHPWVIARFPEGAAEIQIELIYRARAARA